MADFVSTDIREMLAMTKWFQKAPKKFAVASGQLLNNQAFGSKKEIKGFIGRNMTLRNAGFITGKQMPVKKSGFKSPISRQKSVVGSVKTARYSGLEEQETGRKSKRQHGAAVKGRTGGKRRGRVRQQFRLNNVFLNPATFPRRRGFKGKNRDHQVQIMLKRLQEFNFDDPFIITGHSKIPPGLYKFVKGMTDFGQRKIGILQRFKSPAQPARVRWMTMSVKNYLRRNPPDREFIRVARRLVKRSR